MTDEPSFMGYLRQILVITLEREGGLGADTARACTDCVVTRICARFGGERAYIARARIDPTERAAAIVSESRNGTPQRQIAQKLGISPSTVSRTARALRRRGGFGREEWNL